MHSGKCSSLMSWLVCASTPRRVTLGALSVSGASRGGTSSMTTCHTGGWPAPNSAVEKLAGSEPAGQSPKLNCISAPETDSASSKPNSQVIIRITAA